MAQGCSALFESPEPMQDVIHTTISNKGFLGFFRDCSGAISGYRLYTCRGKEGERKRKWERTRNMKCNIDFYGRTVLL